MTPTKTDEMLKLFDIKISNVISLEEKRKELGECKHSRFLISQDEAFVTCGDCGEKLDPMWVLSIIAKNQNTLATQLHRQYVKLCNIETVLSSKSRTKCKHCGKMTPVNIRMSDREWMGWNSVKGDE